MKGIGRELFALFLFTLISSSMLKSKPSEYNCSIRQGFNFEKDAQDVVGHLCYLKIGSLELSADFTVTDPEDVTNNTVKVVGIMDQIYWEGGYLDPISFIAQVSNTNKNYIVNLLSSTLSNTSVQIIFCIYDYDPDEKKYYQAFHSNYVTLLGYITKSAGEIGISIDSNPSGEVVSPQNFALAISIDPNDTDQTLHLAVSVSDKFTKKWGLVVPVQLVSFTALCSGNSVQLDWQTATEVNNYGFEIERTSCQTKIWEKIGFVEGHGNSNSPKEYSFIDKTVTSGKYIYRLKQIDSDGKFEYSKVIEITINTPSDFELFQNYPNPFNPTTTIRFGMPHKDNARLTILNSIGEEMRVLLNEEKEVGYHSIDFYNSNLPSGVYFYQLKAGNFIDTKKMLLLK